MYQRIIIEKQRKHVVQKVFIRKKKSEPPKNRGGQCSLGPEKKCPKIADFGDFDFQNTQNQQNSKNKILPSKGNDETETKNMFFFKSCVFLCFFLVLSPAVLRK